MGPPESLLHVLICLFRFTPKPLYMFISTTSLKLISERQNCVHNVQGSGQSENVGLLVQN